MMIRKSLFLIALCCFLAACKSPPPQPQAEPQAEIEVKEPVFSIASITILQADLINTRLKLTLMIENPNMFPINFSSFRYDLYGNGRFWVGDKARNIALIPANSSTEADFECEMNFIGMNRRLLDDIIAMRQVNYRIAGDVEIETGLETQSVFTMDFDYSGSSVVKK